jgi:hypothetical protein
MARTMHVGMFSGGAGAGGRTVFVPKRKDLNAPHMEARLSSKCFYKTMCEYDNSLLHLRRRYLLARERRELLLVIQVGGML